MMPRTVHRTIDHQSLCQWPAVMRARRADGEQIGASSGHKNRFAERMSQMHFSIPDAFRLIAFFEVRSLKFGGCFSHRIPFVLTYESHWTDPSDRKSTRLNSSHRT